MLGLGHMRLTPAVFWNMSLAEFLLAVRGYHRQQEAQRQQDFFRTGTLVAAIYNVNRDPHKGAPFTASDIFPFLPKVTAHAGEEVWSEDAYTEEEEDET